MGRTSTPLYRTFYSKGPSNQFCYNSAVTMYSVGPSSVSCQRTLCEVIPNQTHQISRNTYVSQCAFNWAQLNVFLTSSANIAEQPPVVLLPTSPPYLLHPPWSGRIKNNNGARRFKRGQSSFVDDYIIICPIVFSR